jgi:hypothetical protein
MAYINGRKIYEDEFEFERTLNVTENNTVLVNNELIKNDLFYLPNL